MTPLFIAIEKFDPSDGQKWIDYAQWAKIPGLTELVSLDSIMCPRLPGNVEEKDWQHNVHADYRLNYFYHLDYLVNRVGSVPRRNILGLYRNPDSHIEQPPTRQEFAFLGYDLIEEATQVSALTNCGGFPETFSNDELNQYGLIGKFGRAREIRGLLPERNPAEHHAVCELYAIWRLAEVTRNL